MIPINGSNSSGVDLNKYVLKNVFNNVVNGLSDNVNKNKIDIEDIKTIIDKALSARKAREAAKKAREAVRKSTEKKTRTTLPGKLADCSSKDRSKCEIFIVEGMTERIALPL